VKKIIFPSPLDFVAGFIQAVRNQDYNFNDDYKVNKHKRYS
jgi:hypothetical protein